MRFILFLFATILHLTTHAQLDVQVAVPLFLRQGDRMELKAVLQNTTSKELTGQAELQLTNAQSGESVDGWFQNVFPAQYLTVSANSVDTLRFPVEVPYLFYNTLAWKLVVRLLPAGKDSAMMITKNSTLPIFTNKSAHSETAVLPPNAGLAKLEGLLQSENDENIEHASLNISAATDPALLLYPRLLQQANSDGETIVDVVDRFFALSVLQSARFKPVWRPVVQGQIITQLPPQGNAPQDVNASYSQSNLLGAALLNITAYQTTDGGFRLLPGGETALPATIQGVRKLIWLSQLQLIPDALTQQVSDVLAKATRWLYRQSIAEIANPADAHALPELFYTYSIMSYSDAAKSRLPQMAQRLQYEKIMAAQGKVYYLLGLRNSLSAQHQQLFEQLTSDTVLLQYPDVSAMLLTYAAAESLEQLKPNLVRTTMQSDDDVCWAAYAMLKAFAPSNTAINAATLRLGTATVQVPDSSSFFTTIFQPPFIKPDMGTVTASAPHAWTLVTWMYHQEQPTDADTLTVKKNWFKKAAGNILEPLEPGTPLKVGDVLTVRLTLNADASAYDWLVHDSWPAAMAVYPATHNNALKYNLDGITFSTLYLQSPFVFDYNLLVTHAGNFSSGVTTVEDAADNKKIANLPPQTFYIE